MRNDRQETEHLAFAPLPTRGRDSKFAVGKGSHFSGAEQIVGIGALCDFVDRPKTGDRTVHFRVSEYCELDSGLAVEIRDLGFNLSTTFYTGNQAPNPDPAEGLTIEFLTEEVRNLTGPEVRSDGSVSEEEHDWDELALCAQNAGLKITGHELQALGYSVVFTERVKQQIPQS